MNRVTPRQPHRDMLGHVASQLAGRSSFDTPAAQGAEAWQRPERARHERHGLNSTTLSASLAAGARLGGSSRSAASVAACTSRLVGVGVSVRVRLRLRVRVRA